VAKKGSEFERDTCRRLSLWLSDGEHDDWLWRSATSGARATVRARKGKSTRGHCGDIAATCPEGERLTKLVTIELKRGYQHVTGIDLIDSVGGGNIAKFIAQAKEARQRAGTPYWMLIHKRDRRAAVVYAPPEFLGMIQMGELNNTAVTRFDDLLDWDAESFLSRLET